MTTTPPPAPAPAKPAILQDSTFTVEEGLAYRLFRTGAIWMNKLFFSSLALLAVWLVLAMVSDDVACADSRRIVQSGNGTVGDEPDQHCSAFLTPTAKYLGAMALLSFALSIALGALGLVVGKNVLEVRRAQDEVGAGAEGTHGQDGDVPRGGA